MREINRRRRYERAKVMLPQEVLEGAVEFWGGEIDEDWDYVNKMLHRKQVDRQLLLVGLDNIRYSITRAMEYIKRNS